MPNPGSLKIILSTLPIYEILFISYEPNILFYIKKIKPPHPQEVEALE